MTATSVIEYYRQFAFVSSVLAGFAFTLYGVLLGTSHAHKAASWSSLLAVAASIAFLIVTLGMTFAAAVAAHLSEGATMPPAITAEQTPLSFSFLGGIILLFAAFGLGGWIRSRSLGIATTIVASLGLAAAFAVLVPFMH
jgi:hypothetical protein